MLPDFRWLPALATRALQTLAREDLTPRPTLDQSTDTEATTQVNWLYMQLPDHDILRQAIWDVLTEGGHCHLLLPDIEDYPSDKGLEVDCIDTPPMSPSRRVIIDAVPKARIAPDGPNADDLLNPISKTPASPCYTAASLAEKSPAPAPSKLAKQ